MYATTIAKQQVLVEELLETRGNRELVKVLQQMPVVEVGEILVQLPVDVLVEYLLLFSLTQGGLLLAELPMHVQLDIFKVLSRRKFGYLFEAMPSEAQADLYQHLVQQEQVELLPFLHRATRENVIRLSAYPPETAGGIMSTDFATVQEDMTVAAAIEKVRTDAPSKRTVYYSYVVNKKQEMLGFVTLKDLIMATPATYVADIMHTEFVYGMVEEDREAIANKIDKYDLVALPILNQKMQLIGIVTHDEAMDVLRAEYNEDMQKFMGIAQASQEFNYMDTSAWAHFKKRVVWIVSLAVVGIVSGLIIHSFENALEKLIILALYMPMVADTGGNSGSQAATVVVRALALGQITVKAWWRVIWKECRIALLLAVCLGIIAFSKVLFLSWETDIPTQFSLISIAMVIALALSLQVVTATMIGAGLPILVRRFGGDPAVAASPAITTVVDITGLLIYFGLATAFLFS